MIYDALKAKHLGFIKPSDLPSFKVDWNPTDPA